MIEAPWDPPADAGTLEVPPALQALIASAAKSGAASFNNRFTK